MGSRSAPPSPEDTGAGERDAETALEGRGARYSPAHGLQRAYTSCREASGRPRAHHRHAASEPAHPDDRVLITAEVHDYPSSESGIAADCPHPAHSGLDDGPSYGHSDYDSHTTAYGFRHTPDYLHADECDHRPADYARSHTPDYPRGHGSDGHGRSQTSRRRAHRHRREEDDGAHSLDERCARDLDEILPARLAAVNLSREPPPHSWNRNNIAATMERFEPVDYSYAYYDAGQHLSMPSSSKKSGRQRGRGGALRERTSRHNYVTRYGTEENIYEEITDGSRTCPKHRYAPRQSLVSLDRSVVEEEVRRVETRHKRILGELNLSVEAMLMPECESPDSERAEDRDNIEELLRVGPTDELLSPASCNPPDLDSGFSGSSSGASYVGSLRRKPTGSVPHLPAVAYGSRGGGAAGVRILAAEECGARCPRDHTSPRSSSCGDAKTSGFWNKKAWKKISGFSSSNSINKAGLTGLLVRYTFRRKSGSQSSQGASAGKRRGELKCDACLSQRC